MSGSGNKFPMTLSAPNYQEPAIAQSFRLWLTSKNYSDSTTRNYLSDLNAYFDFVKNLSSKNSTIYNLQSTIYSPDTISAYLKTIQKNPAYPRYLSSLSKFFQFALDQNLIKTDPLKAALKDKKPSLDEIINQYSDYLNKKNFSQSTIKNYLNDIRQFTDWNSNPIQNPPSPDNSGSPAPLDKEASIILPCPVKGKGVRGIGFKSFKGFFKNKGVSSENWKF